MTVLSAQRPPNIEHNILLAGLSKYVGAVKALVQDCQNTKCQDVCSIDALFDIIMLSV